MKSIKYIEHFTYENILKYVRQLETRHQLNFMLIALTVTTQLMSHYCRTPESDSDSDLQAAISASLTDSWYDDSARFMTCDYVHPFYLLNFIILQTNSLLSQFLYVILSYVCQQAGASEQFLNGTSAHNRPFQCQYMVLRLKTTYT